MIIISDGDPGDPTPGVVQALVKQRIKVSTVAVGTHGPPQQTPLLAAGAGDRRQVPRAKKSQGAAADLSERGAGHFAATDLRARGWFPTEDRLSARDPQGDRGRAADHRVCDDDGEGEFAGRGGAALARAQDRRPVQHDFGDLDLRGWESRLRLRPTPATVGRTTGPAGKTTRSCLGRWCAGACVRPAIRGSSP